MGLLENVTGTLAQQVSQRGVGVVVAAGLGAFLVLAVVLNVLSQLLLKNPNEPPIVFHWFPIVGSTILYGMDPYKFFFDCRAKVSLTLVEVKVTVTDGLIVWQCLHIYSTGEEDYGIPGQTGQ
jgi:hypothetical protein